MTGKAAPSIARDIQIAAMDGFSLAATVYEPNGDRVDGVVMVGAQSGYWKLWPPRQRLRFGLLWHLGMLFMG